MSSLCAAGRLDSGGARGRRRLTAGFSARELELALHGRALVVDLQATFEDRDGGARLAVESQRPAEVIEGVCVRETRFAGRFQAAFELLARGGDRLLEDRDRAGELGFSKQRMPASL